MDEKHEYLKVPEVAGVLRIARSRAYELVGSGEIPSVRVGKLRRIPARELRAYVDALVATQTAGSLAAGRREEHPFAGAV